MSELVHDELEDNSPMSEAAALNDILCWSESRAPWQRDALKRLVTLGNDLSANDIDELYEICINENSDFSPLKSDNISPENIEDDPVTILKIANPTGVNALANNQNLNFAVAGLTVVYGDNGSGKSGYVRILKHACRTRDSKLNILPDINAPKSLPQTADIHFAKGASQKHIEWSPSGVPNASLASVSIFDTRSANTHLGGQHHVAYTPFPMVVLSELSGICEKIKEKISFNIANLSKQTPLAISQHKLNNKTAAGAFLSKLSSKTNLSELDILVNLTADEKSRYESLQSDLSGDPSKVTAQLNSLKSRLGYSSNSVQQLIHSTSEKEFTKFRAQQNLLVEKSELAVAASDKLFEASPLPDIGGARWRSLWEAARTYSDYEANKEKEFPNVDHPDDLCVLCQQPLEKDTIDRWSTFEEFIKGTTKLDEQNARSELELFISNLRSKKVSVSDIRDLRLLVKKEIGNSTLARKIQHSSLIANLRFEGLLKHSENVIEQIPFPQDDIKKAIKTIEIRISDIKSAEDADKRDQLLLEMEGYKDRMSLAAIKDDIISEIERLKNISQLKAAEKTTAKISITKKNKELSDKLVTNVLRARFAREINKFDLIAMPVELKKQSDRNAQSYFKVVLLGKPDESIGEILSEGEHRCVALAAFLAELVTSNDYSGIVFDDPMSSLDHIYRGKVAKRLAEEAEHRQVIIFTHDISFLFEITREAKEQSRSIVYQTIRRNSKSPGIVEADLPFKAKMSGSMENSIRSQLKSLKGSFDNKLEIERTMIATGIIALIRKAWEQGIADFIEPVLARFDDSVKVGSLFKLLVLEEGDVVAAQSARSRLSKDVHATSHTLNPAEVNHSQLVSELDLLAAWLQRLRENQKKAVKPSNTS